jgi:hypothetical protein
MSNRVLAEFPEHTPRKAHKTPPRKIATTFYLDLSWFVFLLLGCLWVGSRGGLSEK